MRFESFYRATKWAIIVGGLFAAHRYYRTRELDLAGRWFAGISFLTFTQVWISYGLQEFVTERGSRKSIAVQARNEYHSGAYKAYV